MDSCGDHYGSKCNFSCSVGYRLNGSSTVTCNAPGNSPPGVWDSPIPVCQGTFSRYNIDQCRAFHLYFNMEALHT